MLFESFNVAVSVETIVILLMVGAGIKHVKMFENVSNQIIPIALFVISVALTAFSMKPITESNLITWITVSLANTIAAVGVHSSGKNVFANGKFVELFLKKYEKDLEIPMENIEIKNVDEQKKEDGE